LSELRASVSALSELNLGEGGTPPEPATGCYRLELGNESPTS